MKRAPLLRIDNLMERMEGGYRPTLNEMQAIRDDMNCAVCFFLRLQERGLHTDHRRIAEEIDLFLEVKPPAPPAETMEIIRVYSVWIEEEYGTFLSPEGVAATQFVPRPCRVDTKVLAGDDGRQCEAVIFVDLDRRAASVCLIPADAPEWAEEAIRNLIPYPYPNRG